MGQPIQFSDRENQVIELLIQGKSNKEIALALRVSLRTVEYHLSHIYAKLGVTSRTEAALRLSKTSLRESTGEDLRETTVHPIKESDDNLKRSSFVRWIQMNKSSIIGILVLVLTAVLCLLSLYIMVKERSPEQEAPSNTTTALVVTSTSRSFADSETFVWMPGTQIRL